MAKRSSDTKDRREAARLQAEALRNQAKKRERVAAIVISAISVVVVGLIVLAGVIIYQASQTTLLSQFEGAKPERFDNRGGVEIGAGGAGEPNAGALEVQIYMDFGCPACQAFETVNAEDVKALVDDGTITLVYHPIIFQEAGTSGFSSRAADAFAGVVAHSPEHALDFVASVFTELPTTASSAELSALAVQVGVPDDVAGQIADGTYVEWAGVATQQAQRDGVGSTPTIYVDGDLLDPEVNWQAPGAFAAFLQETAGVDVTGGD